MSLFTLIAFAFLCAALYYICPLRLRWILLLLVSYGYYAYCGLSALPYILTTTLSTWAGALLIGRVGEQSKTYLREHKAELDAAQKKAHKAKARSRQRALFFAVLLLNFGILAVLKYMSPLLSWGASLAGKTAPGHQLLHVPVDGLPHRRIQRQIRPGKEPGTLCAVRVLLPPADSGTDCAL